MEFFFKLPEFEDWLLVSSNALLMLVMIVEFKSGLYEIMSDGTSVVCPIILILDLIDSGKCS